MTQETEFYTLEILIFGLAGFSSTEELKTAFDNSLGKHQSQINTEVKPQPNSGNYIIKVSRPLRLADKSGKLIDKFIQNNNIKGVRQEDEAADKLRACQKIGLGS